MGPTRLGSAVVRCNEYAVFLAPLDDAAEFIVGEATTVRLTPPLLGAR